MGDTHILRNGVTQCQSRVAKKNPAVVSALVGIIVCAKVKDCHVAVDGNTAHGTPDMVAIGFNEDVNHLVLAVHGRNPRL